MPGASTYAGMPDWTPDSALPPPDFAIVGAPKCGTTALYSYLATHPGIAMSTIKEPCFWSRDVDVWWRTTDPAEYQALWQDAPPGALRGEASPVYMQSLVAIPDLLAARPDIRLIAMVRNPVDIAITRHASMVVLYQEDVADFEAAWRLQERRLAGEAVPPRCTERQLLQYRANALVGDHLERFLALVPAPQRIVIVYDDFRADPRREYLRALALLGLDDDGRMEFPLVNTRKALRWTGLLDFRDWVGKRLGRLLGPAKALAKATGFHPFAPLYRANQRPSPRKPLRPGFEEELIAEFVPQVEKVERLLGRGLTAWKTRSR